MSLTGAGQGRFRMGILPGYFCLIMVQTVLETDIILLVFLYSLRWP